MAITDRLPVDAPERELRQACAALDRGLRAGTTRAEDLLAEHSTLASSPDLAVELIFSEFVTRETLGQQPTPDDYYTRFPQWRDRLERLFQVDALLKDDSDTHVNSGASFPARAAGPLPAHVGPYELLEELGRGGMGVVYKAYHPTLRRVAALKLLRYGVDATGRERERFRREAEVIARLQHPNIVQVFEVGDHEGQPYLALEYVADGTLRAKLGGKPLPPADAATLVETLADAVQHAHSHGVVHRDLKPGNILLVSGGVVSGEWSKTSGTTQHSPFTTHQPKVSDFGLATLFADDQSASSSGHIVGTVSYMAPEQALGAPGWVTPAVDVYALGAILYECLTGRPPFLADSDIETLRQVVHVDPPSPHRLQPGLPRDLDTICMKCLAKEPRRRYASAAELADDLRRFREHRPIVARPVGLLVRTAKWARRQPAVAALILVCVLSTAVLVGVVAAYTDQLRSALADARWHQQRAEGNERIALAARATADEQRDQTRHALDALAKLTDAAFVDQPRLVRQYERTIADVLGRYEQLAASGGDGPTARLGAAQARLRAGRLQKLLGRFDDAERSLIAACEEFERLSTAAPADVARGQDWAEALDTRATLRAGRGEITAGIGDYRSALEVIERLMAAEPGEPQHRNRWAGLVVRIGTQAVRLHQSLESTADIDRAAAIWHEQLTRDPNDPDARIGRAGCDRFYGFLAQRQNRLTEAEAHFRAAVDRLGPADGPGGLRAYRAQYQSELAGVLVAQNRGTEAEPLIRAALAESERRAAAAPDVPEYRASVAFVQGQLAKALHLQRKYVDAEAAYAQALPILAAAAVDRPDQPEAATTLGADATNYGQLLLRTGRPNEALARLDQAVTALEPVAPRNDSPVFAGQYLTLALTVRAEALTTLGRHAEAAGDWQKVLAREPKARPEWRVACAQALARGGRAADALATLEPLKGVTLPTLTVFEAARAYALAAASPDPAVAEKAATTALATLNVVQKSGAFRNPDRVEQLRTHADWAAVRGRPEFEKLLDGMLAAE